MYVQLTLGITVDIVVAVRETFVKANGDEGTGTKRPVLMGISAPFAARRFS
jgi:hypothetical protein